MNRGLVSLIAAILCCMSGARQVCAGGFVLATERAGTTVAKIDVTTDQVIGRATLGNVPSAVTIDRGRRWVYISINLGDKISVVHADAMAAADVSIPGLGRQPIGVALTSDCSRLLVATRGTDGVVSADDRLDVVQLDNTHWPPTGSIVTSIPTGLHPVGVCIDHTDRYAVVTVRNQPAILIVDLQTYQVVWQAQSLPADAEPEGCDLHPTANIAYVTLHGPASTIEVIDLNTPGLIRHVPIVSTPVARPSGGHFAPDGARFFVSGQTINKVLMFDSSTPSNPMQVQAVQLSVGPQPHTIVYFPDGRAYVANTNNGQPTGSISVIHNYSGTPTVTGPILTNLAGPLDLANFSWAILGDMNCDGAVSINDIAPFVTALLDPAGYVAQHPLCSVFNADMNQDLQEDGLDIRLFVNTLVGS
jgi:DNA-binding beta-propeller fold protein YncE